MSSMDSSQMVKLEILTAIYYFCAVFLEGQIRLSLSFEFAGSAVVATLHRVFGGHVSRDRKVATRSLALTLQPPPPPHHHLPFRSVPRRLAWGGRMSCCLRPVVAVQVALPPHFSHACSRTHPSSLGSAPAWCSWKGCAAEAGVASQTGGGSWVCAGPQSRAESPLLPGAESAARVKGARGQSQEAESIQGESLQGLAVPRPKNFLSWFRGQVGPRSEEDVPSESSRNWRELSVCCVQTRSNEAALLCPLLPWPDGATPQPRRKRSNQQWAPSLRPFCPLPSRGAACGASILSVSPVSFSMPSPCSVAISNLAATVGSELSVPLFESEWRSPAQHASPLCCQLKVPLDINYDSAAVSFSASQRPGISGTSFQTLRHSRQKSPARGSRAV